MAESEEDLLCPLCSELYNDDDHIPLTLPRCGHTFCRTCLNGCGKKGHFPCPTCRKRHLKPPVDQMPPDVDLLTRAEIFKEETLGRCSSHGNLLEYWCRQCNVPLCEACQEDEGHDIIKTQAYLAEKKLEVKEQGHAILQNVTEEKQKLMSTVKDCSLQLLRTCQVSTITATSGDDIKAVLNETKKTTNLKSALGNLKKMKSILGNLRSAATEDTTDTESDNEQFNSLTESQKRLDNSAAEVDNEKPNLRIRQREKNPTEAETEKEQQLTTQRVRQPQGETNVVDAANEKPQIRRVRQRQRETTDTESENEKVLSQRVRQKQREQKDEYHPNKYMRSRSKERERKRDNTEKENFQKNKNNNTYSQRIRQASNPPTKEVKNGDNNNNSNENYLAGSPLIGLLDSNLWPLKCCVYGVDGRKANLSWEDGKLHLYALTDEESDAHFMIKMSILQSLIPQDNPEVFIDATAGDQYLGRIYISLWGHLRRAHNFLAMCMGTHGPSYRGSRFQEVFARNIPGECLHGGVYKTKRGSECAAAVLKDLEWEGTYRKPMTKGHIVGAGSGRNDRDACFDICTKSNSCRLFACPFGEVVAGWDVVMAIIKHRPVRQVFMTEVGVVIPDQVETN